MTKLRDGRNFDMLHNGTQILFDYWNGLRGDRAAPMRVEISPAAISQILPSTFILQSNENGALEFRLAGTALCLLFGGELKGRTLKSLIDAHDRQLLDRLLQAAHCEKVALQLQLHAIADDDKHVNLECIILPLGDEKPRLLGALHALDMPYWVGAEQIVSTSLSSVRLLDPQRDLICLHNRPSVLMHERARALKLKRKTPRFSVLQGGAMLGGPQMAQAPVKDRRRKLTLLPGGLD